MPLLYIQYYSPIDKLFANSLASEVDTNFKNTMTPQMTLA